MLARNGSLTKPDGLGFYACSHQCCGAGAGRSRGFLAGARADLKFKLESEPIFWGRLRLLFLTSERQNDLKMFNFQWTLYSTVHIFV